MHIDDPEYYSLYLKPGEIYFGEEPAVVSTVLGSCVSVTMYHPGLQIGAICHGLLPVCTEEKPCDGSCLKEFKYLDCAIKRMISMFDVRQVRRSEIEVKIFGGADMFGVKSREGDESVGRENVKIAMKVIEMEGLVLKASDTYGSYGRKLIFRTNTGEVFLKRLQRT